MRPWVLRIRQKFTHTHTITLTQSSTPTPTPIHENKTYSLSCSHLSIFYLHFARASMIFPLCFLCYPHQKSKQTTLNPTVLHDIHLIFVPHHLTIKYFHFNQLLTRSFCSSSSFIRSIKNTIFIGSASQCKIAEVFQLI